MADFADRLSRALGCEFGGALIETALAMPLLAALVFGAAEFGLADYQAIEVANAAKAAVQYGAQDTTKMYDTTGIDNAARQDAPNIALTVLPPVLTQICSNGSAPPCSGGATQETLLTVATQASFNPIIHVPGLTPSLTLKGQASQTVMH